MLLSNSKSLGPTGNSAFYFGGVASLPAALPSANQPAFPTLPLSQQTPLDLSTRSSSQGSLPSSESSIGSNSPRKATSVTEFMHSQGT